MLVRAVGLVKQSDGMDLCSPVLTSHASIGASQRPGACADNHEGRKGLVLRFLESLGIGFDS